MERPDPGEIVKRALAYPYERPERSYVLEGGEAAPWPAALAGLDLAGRAPLLAYGANASPRALARKLAALPEAPLFAARATLEHFDVVYSAHVSPYGAVPATLLPSPGTSVEVHVIYPSVEQLPLLSATEPNYELARLRDVSLRPELGPDQSLGAVDAYRSRHGPLLDDGAPLALTAIPARGRRLRALSEPEVLELVRARVSPDVTLERFILACAESGGIAPLPNPRNESASTRLRGG